jgi:hypothetical protein
MPSPEIEEFGRILVEKVRDASIKSCDRRFQANATSPAAKRWKEAARKATPEEFAKLLIPDVVDHTMFCFLHAIDDSLLRLSYSASQGKVVDLNTEGQGELGGWWGGGSEGWLTIYAKERFVDDVADLENFFQS